VAPPVPARQRLINCGEQKWGHEKHSLRIKNPNMFLSGCLADGCSSYCRSPSGARVLDAEFSKRFHPVQVSYRYRLSVRVPVLIHSPHSTLHTHPCSNAIYVSVTTSPWHLLTRGLNDPLCGGSSFDPLSLERLPF
jgi:hypothetical protein